MIIRQEMLPFIHNVLYNETGKDGLIAMKHFSLERVRHFVLDPGKRNGDLYLATFASSPMLLSYLSWPFMPSLRSSSLSQLLISTVNTIHKDSGDTNESDGGGG